MRRRRALSARGVTFAAFAAFLWGAPVGLQAQTAEAPPLAYTCSWIGNSHGRGDGRWVQNNILGLHVAADGTVFTQSWWDEGRRESGIYSGADGTPIGALESLHDTFGGGFAVTGDAHYIYASNWDTVRRCERDGKPAPFPGGGGKYGDSIDVSTAPTGTNKGIGVRGLAVDPAAKLLFVSESTDGEVEAWSTETMTLVRKWAFPRPGPLAVGPDGSLWIISRREAGSPAAVWHYSAAGEKLAEEITGGAGFDPTGICYDGAGKRLLVTDNGPAQDIQIFRTLNRSHTAPEATFGTGILPLGKVTETRFGSSGLTGVGTDAAGNLYVSMNGVGPESFWHGGGTVLESWTAEGRLRWRKIGLAFVDCADADPASEAGDALDVFDKYSRYRLDLGKTTAGTEATYAGHTLNQFKYPADQRFVRAVDGWDYTGATFVRNVGGHRLLYVLSMQARRLLIYRFNPAKDGEVAIPAGLWESQYGYRAGYPGSPAARDFIWRDANGNGAFDADEFAAGPGMPNLGVGLWVDARGDLWSCNHWTKTGIGIRRWKMQGFDAVGNPIYDYADGHYIEYPRPEGCHGELRRVEYFPDTDTMYVSSTSRVDGDRDAGHRIVKYTRWSQPDRAVAWTLDPPMDGTKISALSVAGDHLFLGYSYFGSNSREGTIRIHKTSDASLVGEMTPTPAVGSLSGTFDIPYAIRAFRRRNGEYLVFAEDDHFARVLMYRWNPAGGTVVDSLEDLAKTDPERSSAEWKIDRSNPQFFSGDHARAVRSADTAQHLVWRASGLRDFAVSIYTDVRKNLDPLVGFSASANGRDWSPVATTRTPPLGSGGGWAVTTFRPATGALPRGASYLRLELAPSGVNWEVQVGRVELFGTAAP